MGLDMGAGAGGADMLQQVLARKMQEQQMLAQQKFAQAKLAEDVRQANMQNAVQQGNLALGGRRVDEDVRQFDAQAPLRIANVGHLNASTSELQRKPQAEQTERDFTLARDKNNQTFTAGQQAARFAFEGREGAANRANARDLSGMRLAAIAGKGQPNADQQANEVADTIALIDQIQNDPARSANVGPINSRGLGLIRDPGGNARFTSLHDQLVGKMSLAQAGKLKGQGQISDKERAMLASAATALNRGLEDPDYINELKKVRDQFVRMQGGPMPVAAPAPAGADADPLGLFAKK